MQQCVCNIFNEHAGWLLHVCRWTVERKRMLLAPASTIMAQVSITYVAGLSDWHFIEIKVLLKCMHHIQPFAI